MCDLDVDAICGWQVWRALRADVLVGAVQNAVYEMCFTLIGFTGPLTLPDFDAEFRASVAHHAAALAGLTPPDRPGPERPDLPLVSELPKGTS